MTTILSMVIAVLSPIVAIAQDGLITLPNFGNCDKATLYIVPTVAGTSLQDFTKPGLIVTRRSDGTAFAAPTTPGTPFQDFTKPGYIIERQ